MRKSIVLGFENISLSIYIDLPANENASLSHGSQEPKTGQRPTLQDSEPDLGVQSQPYRDLSLCVLSHWRRHHHLHSSILRLTDHHHPASPPAPPQPVQETQREFISSTSDGSTTTGLAGPSTSPSASAASTRTRTFSPTTGHLFPLAVASAMMALQRQMRDNTKDHDMLAVLFGLPPDKMEFTRQSLLVLLEIMQSDTELQLEMEAVFSMRGLRSVIELTEVLLAERKKRDGSGGSCGGSKGGGGGPDSGSGEGDGGEGGGVTA